MNTIQQGIELGNLAKLMFDKSVKLWYTAIGIEVVIGLLAVLAGLFVVTDAWNIFFALAGFLLLIYSYFLKIRFNVTYGHAETMRRQSVFTAALEWPISKTQFSEWRMFAGPDILKALGSKKGDPDYFATKEKTGSKRLLEMTQESAFWTRHLYCYLRNYIWITFVLAVGFFVIVLTLVNMDFVTHTTALKIVYALYLLLPLVLTIDLFGLGFKLNQLISSLKEIEDSLERLSNEEKLREQEVLRLVAEYNCQVVSGIPIPGWFFGKHHDLIASLWKQR